MWHGVVWYISTHILDDYTTFIFKVENYFCDSGVTFSNTVMWSHHHGNLKLYEMLHVGMW